jgi:hypothetical protein
MAETEKQVPANSQSKGGRKGGTLFPKINLEQALTYAKKLVSKTHTGAQPEETILPGVFGSSSTPGKVRASALKQYGLLEGNANAYKASQLAKDIDAALDSDRHELLRRAFLSSKLFNQLFQTFHGDKVSKSKIEQRAKGLDVHPDSAGECAQLFIESAATAGLGTIDGDTVVLAKAGGGAPIIQEIAIADAEQTAQLTAEENKRPSETEDPGISGEADHLSVGVDDDHAPSSVIGGRNARPGVSLNLTVDPSSDPDKLEKQLKLLRQFGLI